MVHNKRYIAEQAKIFKAPGASYAPFDGGCTSMGKSVFVNCSLVGDDMSNDFRGTLPC